MLFTSKNSIWSLMKVPFFYSPLLAIVTTIQRVVEAFFPALNVLVVAGFINTATEIFSKNIENSAIYEPLTYLIILLAFQLLFSTIMGYFTRKMQIKFDNRINLECVEKRASFDFKYIDASESFMMIKKTFGELGANITKIHNDLLNAVNLLIRFFSIMVIFVANDLWWAGVLIILVALPMISVSYFTGKKIYAFYKKNYPGEMEMYHSTYILKNRNLTDERTLFGFTNVINQKWKLMELELYKKKMAINKRIWRNQYAARFINIFCAFIIISCVTYFMYKGTMTIGLYIALVTSIIALIDQVISNAMSWANNLAQEKEFLKDFNSVCNYTGNSDSLCLPHEKSILIKKIEFHNVSFSYPDTQRKVLDGISFTMTSDRHYGIVGKNGAGKSTLIKLLTGLYDDYSGYIVINDKNIKDYSFAERKAMFGIIYQDYAKYELTVKESIGIGSINDMSINDIDTMQYNQIIKEVGLESLIEKLPKGLDTFLGKSEEGGQDISGGEWQRVAIARLLMKNSNFMILDEPTAALDPLAESKLYEHFSQISKHKTTLLISHRLGSIKNVDHIFVIDEGKLIEEGTHQELTEHTGLYNELYSEQKEWYL